MKEQFKIGDTIINHCGVKAIVNGYSYGDTCVSSKGIKCGRQFETYPENCQWISSGQLICEIY